MYFSDRYGKVWFASNQHLLAKQLNLSSTQDPSKLGFYRSAVFNRLDNSDLGNTTYYDEITQLISNHYYDVNSKKEVLSYLVGAY